jgi:hypothetical protein
MRQRLRKEKNMRVVFARLKIHRCRWQPALSKGLLLVVALFVTLPALAHHSYAAFDSTQTRTLTGTVKSVQWGNPHVELKLLVKPDEGGEPQEWNIETHSPAIMMRHGWTTSSLKYGDHVNVVCNPMKDGSHSCRLHTVLVLETGQLLETKLSVATKLKAD